VSHDVKDMFEDAVALGRRNQTMVELARRHCLNLEFRKSGGSGMAEAATGLPIDMRRVHCAFAREPGGMAMNLEWIVVDFYRANCVGCEYRRPTQDLPNLATHVADLGAKEAERTAAADIEKRERGAAWARRNAERQALAGTAADPAVVAALGDIGVVDGDPRLDVDREAVAAARRRLEALADRAPELVSSGLFAHLCRLVSENGQTALLSVIRRVGRRIPEHRPSVLKLALEVLRCSSEVEAGRTVVELGSDVTPNDFDQNIVGAAIVLAGRPTPDYYGRHRRVAADNEPALLRLAGDHVPDLVVAEIQKRLAVPVPAPSLVLAVGLRGSATPTQFASDMDRYTAAGAVAQLLPTHPSLVAALAGGLARSLAGGRDKDRYNLRPSGSLARTLAIMFCAPCGDVSSALDTVASETNGDGRKQLFGVLEQVESVLDPDGRWRESNDPALSDQERLRCVRRLIDACLARLSFDWDDDVAHSAARLLAELAKDYPAEMVQHVPVLMGTVVLSLDRHDARPVSPLLAQDQIPPALAALQESSRQFTLRALVGRLLDAVEQTARVDLVSVLDTIVDMIGDAREHEDRGEIPWRLLPRLGALGRRYGSELGVLNRILPVLYTYLLDNDPAMRSTALRAWTDIASDNDVPSVMEDLLPALLQDQYVLVIRALLRAAGWLSWSDPSRRLLIQYSLTVAQASKESDRKTLRAALAALRNLTRDDSTRSAFERYILDRAAEIEPHDLERFLFGSWSPSSACSPQMARLRLILARDPSVNDRFNAHDDDELVDLLNVGKGLLSLPPEDLIDAARELGEEYTIPALEFAEVAWRAASPGLASQIATSLLARLPDQPAYYERRAVCAAVSSLAELDASALIGDPAKHSYLDVVENCERLADGDQADGYLAELRSQIHLRVLARAVLLGSNALTAICEATSNSAPAAGIDVADEVQHRALLLTRTAQQLAVASVRRTPTSLYVRSFAGACAAAAYLLRCKAAQMVAAGTEARRSARAARQRASSVLREISGYSVDDPLFGPLLSTLKTFNAVTEETDLDPLLMTLGSLAVPMIFVGGPREWQRASAKSSNEVVPAAPLIVALAKVDGLLVTGPLVLRPATVYTLGIELRTGPWPQWADTLEAEFIGSMSAAEAQFPSFTWRRQDLGSGGDVLEGEGTLILRFALPAGRPAPPFRVALRFRGTRESKPAVVTCDVAGHRELRFRPFDETRDAQTGQPMVDERLLTIYEGLHGAGYNETHLQAFARLLTAIVRAGLEMTWNRQYRRAANVTERKFHDDLHQLLMADPDLSGRVERGTPLALGFLDVRHDGVTAELKVERTTPVTRGKATKYIGQPTQYAAADGVRLSILCVLDMSRKVSPIGTAENYIFQLSPDLHGLTNPEAPSIVTVVIIQGANPPPSSWSRRRLPAQVATPAEFDPDASRPADGNIDS